MGGFCMAIGVRINSFLLFLCLITNYAPTTFTLQHNEVTLAEKQSVSKKMGLVAVKTAIALPLMWLSHFGFELFSTAAHEALGHGLTNKLLTGNPIRVNLGLTYHNPIEFLCMPWHGQAAINPHNTKQEVITTLAGPIVGIATTYLQLFSLRLIQGILEQQSFKETIKQAAQEPLTTFKDITSHTASLFDPQTKTPSFSSILFDGMRLFRCARIIGESWYGFTPLKINHIHGMEDGKRVWDIVSKKVNKESPELKKNLIMLTAVPLLIPICIGIIKGIKDRVLQ